MATRVLGWSVPVLLVLGFTGCADSAWQNARTADSIPAYEAFLRSHPQSDHAAPARRRLEELQFERAKASGTVSAYAAFLRQYPQSELADETRRNCERLYFDEAEKAASSGAYLSFLERYPHGDLAPEARRRLERLEFDLAKASETVVAFQQFLNRHPQSELAEEARREIELLEFSKAQEACTVEAYERFLKHYALGPLSEQARRELSDLKEDLRKLENAARSALPEQANVRVETTHGSRDKPPEYVISAHLLEGHSADEESSRVRGDYDTREKLTRLIQIRCANILKAVARDALPSREVIVVVRARHGVRTHYGDDRSRGVDKAWTIYEVSISSLHLRDHNVKTMKPESIMQLWNVHLNEIPNLRIERGF